MAWSSISRDRVYRPSSSFNDKSTVRGAVDNNDLALWWSPWLLIDNIAAQGSLKYSGIMIRMSGPTCPFPCVANCLPN